MRTVHPLWRGFYLAVLWAALRILLGPVDELAPFRLERQMVALAGAAAVGAFLSALPSRLRRRPPERTRTSWQRCLLAFFCGSLMALALRLAGGGWAAHALLEGSSGAAGFWLAALPCGFAAVRLGERRRSA